jgi:hypothetical protein
VTRERWIARISVAAVAFALVLLLSLRSAQALVVAALGTNDSPASYVGWTQGDPGWGNIASNVNNVYLGNRWVLTARHVGINNTTFGGNTYAPVSGENFIIHNPPPSMVGGLSLTTETDLRLIRIDGDPGLPALTISSQSPPSSGTSGSQVMFIGNGAQRLATETVWQVNTNDPNNYVWTESSSGNFRGYKTNTTVGAKLWGTNRLANPNDYMPVVKNTLSSTTGVMPLKTPDGVTRDIVTMMTSFDQPGQNGALPFESQAVGGDSGSAVFYKNGSQWELAGIVNSILIYNNQNVLFGVYGDVTTFSDLSYYNKPYQGSICDVMKTCGNYSAVGDVNLDGVVSGNGAGPAQTDDVTAFVAGWRYNNNAGAGDYLSWTHGDMNHDGKTNVDDFMLLRTALNGQISGSALNTLFGGQLPNDGVGSAVPEPCSGSLAVVACALLAWGWRARGRHGAWFS